MSDTPDDDETSEPPRPVHSGPAIAIEAEMRSSYLDYAMSVIVSRAIPDLRDGLKPVHRRILYAMSETGNTHDKPYRKSARPVGDVMGKYHPHGDSAIYDALVRMAQDFSMSLPLLDGQGNFGSMDGDQPAAMRYTEVRMAKPAAYLLADIDKETVDFQPNYDGKDMEPTVLPARFPNMLVNGAGGIAVGMATNIPPHNLGEVIDATLALIESPDLSVADLMEFIPAPDFPTGALILGRSGARKAYHEGRGSVLIRARTRIEEVRGGRTAIIVSEIPYQVNKATLIERIAELARDKRIEGIAHVQDESDRFGVRVVVELRRDATPEVVLNQLYHTTDLQKSFGCNMLALNGGRPEQLDLRKFLTSFIAFREEVVARRTAHELRKARERAHVLCGLAVAVSNVDEVVATIRSSADPAEARERLMTRPWPAADIAPYISLIDDPSHRVREDGTYLLSETQARAILDLRLQRLTALGVKEVTDELEELAGKITDYLDILRSHARIMAIIADELREVKELFAVPRRSEIVEWESDLDDEDLIEREDMVVTVTQGGYIKRTQLTEYRAQRRGGKGTAGMATKDEDFVTRLFVANTHTPLLVFTTAGMVYTLKTWRLPLAGRNGRGKAIVNILPIPPGVGVAAIMPVDVPEAEWASLQIMFATSDGDVRRNALDDFTNVMRNGKIAMKLPDGVRLINARIASEEDDVMLTTKAGRAIRFPVPDVRVFKGRDFDRRPRHPPRRRRRGGLDGDHPPLRGEARRARRLPEDAPRRRRRAGGGGRGGRGRGGRRGQLRARPGPLRRDVRGRGPAAHHHRARRRQALLEPRLPGARPRRPGGRGDGPGDARRPARRAVPGRAGRADHARDRRRPVDPRPRRRHLVPLARRRRGARLQHRRRRARRLRRPDRRERRGGRGLSRLRIGLVGLGMAVTPHARALLDLRDEVEVAAAFSPTEARRSAFAERFPFPLADRLETILDDPTVDAVMVLTPPNTHGELVARAAAAGKHVLLEKPLEVSTARAEALVAACREAGVVLAVVLQHRFRPASERLAALLAEGALGAIAGCSTTIRLWRPQSYYDEPGRGTLARDGGGVLMTQGIHTLDLMLSLAGPITEVTGFTAKTALHRMEAEDLACAAVRFASGALGTIEATTAAYPGFPERIELACTGGSASLVGAGLAVAWTDGRRFDLTPDPGPGGTGADPMAFAHEGHRAVLADFLGAVREGRPPRVSGAEALRVHRLIDALIETGRSGRAAAVAG